MADKPYGSYALGVFCSTISSYAAGVPNNPKTKFMNAFFNAVLEDNPPLEETKEHLKNTTVRGKERIEEGVWAGINKKDLTRFYNGSRKLPAWKATDFKNYFDVEKFCSLFDTLSMDAWLELDRSLPQLGLQSNGVNAPEILAKYLLAILKANADNKDLLADEMPFQINTDVKHMYLPLGEGRIAGGKLILGNSSIPWAEYPATPEKPDLKIEGTYIKQIYLAIADATQAQIHSLEDVPEVYKNTVNDQRRYFYSAEGVRRNMRDVVSHGEQFFADIKNDIYDGVIDSCEDAHPNGLERMRATVRAAAQFPLSHESIASIPGAIKASEKKGICHMLVNDKRLHWVEGKDVS